MSSDPTIERADSLAADGVAHAFFGRQGGVSEGPFASLNFSTRSGDAAFNVTRNRAIAAAHLGFRAERLVHARQVHGIRCLPCAQAWDMAAPPEADALVTREPGLLIGVLTADCAPVLLLEPDARIVGAAHAGWKGAFSGIIESTVAAIEALGGSRQRIRAAIGPAIARRSYEVGPEFLARFSERAAENERYFRPSTRRDHHLFDLAAYVAFRLHEAGVARVQILDLDTLALEDRFFSYRRTTLRQEKAMGLQLSAIGLPG